MTHEQQTRERFERLTDDVVGGPSLEIAIRDGRRTRRRRTTRVGVAAAALTGLGLVAAWQVLPGSTHDVAVDAGPAAAPPYQDFVPGTEVDENLQAAAADHLPGLTDATDVFPSDWDHTAMNPPVRYQDATEWQAYWKPKPNDHLVVFTGKDVPNRPAWYGCDEAPVGPYCSTASLADGSLTLTAAHTDDTATFQYWFLNRMVRPDGSSVSIVEKVTADSWSQAEQRRLFTDTQTQALARDPRLLFPDPIDPPPAPAGY